MIFLLVGAVVLFIVGVNRREMRSTSSWLNKQTTTAINGFFILYVFLNHAIKYVPADVGVDMPWWDGCYMWFTGRFVGGLMVAMFLFNSGFGVMESIKTKGRNYVRQMPVRRILTVLLNFDVAVMIFIALNLLLSKDMSLHQILLSLVGWESVGNSNWYIFAILACYIITYVAFRAGGGGLPFAIGGVALYVLVMPWFKPLHWSGTIVAFPIGLLVSNYKEQIYLCVRKNWGKFMVVTFALYIGGLFLCANVTARGLANNCLTAAFVSLFAVLTVRYDFGNLIILWCGRNLFPIYIYQRLSMIVLADVTGGAPVVFVLLSALATYPIVLLYNKFLRISFCRPMTGTR